MTGLIHLYCGGGKGKTTAAVGLTVRCAGRGNKVVFAQFLKDGTSGECRVLAKLPDVTVMAANPVGKFSFRMTDAEKRETADALTRTFDAATGFAVREHARLLVLDEVCAAISCGFLDPTQQHSLQRNSTLSFWGCVRLSSCSKALFSRKSGTT